MNNKMYILMAFLATGLYAMEEPSAGESNVIKQAVAFDNRTGQKLWIHITDLKGKAQSIDVAAWKTVSLPGDPAAIASITLSKTGPQKKYEIILYGKYSPYGHEYSLGTLPFFKADVMKIPAQLLRLSRIMVEPVGK